MRNRTGIFLLSLSITSFFLISTYIQAQNSILLKRIQNSKNDDTIPEKIFIDTDKYSYWIQTMRS